MSGIEINAYMDLASLDRLHSFANYEAHLEPALLKAMDTGISMLQAAATDYMYAAFINPTGTTESDSWEVDVQGPYLAILGNTAPQAQRLEFGFSGMTDSLGRYYPYWPDYHWAEITVEKQKFKVGDVFQAAIDYANLQLAGGAP